MLKGCMLGAVLHVPVRDVLRHGLRGGRTVPTYMSRAVCSGEGGEVHQDN